MHRRPAPTSGTWLAWRGGQKDPGLRWPILLASFRGWRVQPGTMPTITQKESREPKEQRKNEWSVGRLPIFPKAKQVQFLFICLLVLAPFPSGFLGSMANLSSLWLASWPWFRSLFEFAAAHAAAEDHPRSISIAGAQFAARENWDFGHSGSASLLPFQGLPPEAGSSTLHPPPLPSWLLANPKAVS